MAPSETTDNPKCADFIGNEEAHFIEALLTMQLTYSLSQADTLKE
jgi:hypothetical protein